MEKFSEYQDIAGKKDHINARVLVERSTMTVTSQVSGSNFKYEHRCKCSLDVGFAAGRLIDMQCKSQKARIHTFLALLSESHRCEKSIS